MAPNNRNALDAATSTTGIMTQLIASYELAIGCECTATLSPIFPDIVPGFFCLASRFDFQTGDETHATPITARFTG